MELFIDNEKITEKTVREAFNKSILSNEYEIIYSSCCENILIKNNIVKILFGCCGKKEDENKTILKFRFWEFYEIFEYLRLYNKLAYPEK